MITAPRTTPRTDTAAAAAAATASGTTSTPAGGAMGKDAFMKLLIAQMQNQDPMNPMQGDQMATQLATFSSLEQLQQINATLTSQQSSSGSLLGAIQASSAISTIGHTVVAAGNQLQVGGANGTTSVNADIGAAGASATLHIYNSAGTEVGTRDLGAVSAGRQSFALGDAASGLADGAYTYGIGVKDAGGNAVSVQTYMTGKVDGVSSQQGGIVLTAGKLAIPYASVVQIIN
jgi:flagellar basal-body rod modification protein FlgD